MLPCAGLGMIVYSTSFAMVSLENIILACEQAAGLVVLSGDAEPGERLDVPHVLKVCLC